MVKILITNKNILTSVFQAPGRINIIGEHTDYNEGLVLPTNLDLYTKVTANARDDDIIQVTSSNFGQTESFSINQIAPNNPPTWINYIQGVVAELRENNIPITGADLVVSSDIPIGAGLSSSASLELAIAHALLGIGKNKVAAQKLAQICQNAETKYAGVNCGIMDQQSVACGRKGQAMLLDCRTMESKYVEIPANLSLIVIDSGVTHNLPDGEYNSRTDECRAAVKLLQATYPAIQALRDAPIKLIDQEKDQLGIIFYSRARHVVTEIERTVAAFTALIKKDFRLLGSLISASHASLRDDFDVSCPEIDQLVQIADSCSGVYGTRMIGAGFGGCALSIAEVSVTKKIVDQIRENYSKVLGSEPWIHVLKPATPAMEVRHL